MKFTFDDVVNAARAKSAAPDPNSDSWREGLEILVRDHLKEDVLTERGWGIMNPVALKSAAKIGFPADHVIGNVWSNSEEDVTPAGAAGTGYVSVTTHPSGRDFDVIKDIEKFVVAPGKGRE